jgi:plasmid maintenance system antidote protein VapI
MRLLQDQEDPEGRRRSRAGAQDYQGEIIMNKHDGSTLDSLFEELGELDEINARAAKKTLAIETERRMKTLGLSTTALAQRMGTSRNQIHRILDEADAGITLKMLFRLAGALGMPLRLGFGPPALVGRRRGQAPAGRRPRRTEARA